MKGPEEVKSSSLYLSTTDLSSSQVEIEVCGSCQRQYDKRIIIEDLVCSEGCKACLRCLTTHGLKLKVCPVCKARELSDFELQYLQGLVRSINV
mmetsp:Transcript_19069/g.34647  ORF Transcript_19069/g.34647 Transcript_19069/m.34647 type:complete len:94 (+) Transcript_19069:2215-2496(+)